MIQHKSLKNTDLKEVHIAFTDAFSNYEVPFNLTYQELVYLLERRGYNQELSYGSFYKDKLVGFVLNGIEDWKGVPTAYDTGTGIITEFQGKGIAKDLFTFCIKNLKNKGMHQYLLEVIKTNTKAIQLYKDLGFQISKDYDFYVFDQSKLDYLTSKSSFNISFEETATIENREIERFSSIDPSWQNSMSSIYRKRKNFTVLKASIDNKNIGYGIVEKHTGDIPLLAISPDFRNRGVGTSLLKHLSNFSKSEQIKMINIQSDYKPFKELFRSLQISPGKGQYEMILKF